MQALWILVYRAYIIYFNVKFTTQKTIQTTIQIIRALPHHSPVRNPRQFL